MPDVLSCGACMRARHNPLALALRVQIYPEFLFARHHDWRHNTTPWSRVIVMERLHDTLLRHVINSLVLQQPILKSVSPIIGGWARRPRRASCAAQLSTLPTIPPRWSHRRRARTTDACEILFHSRFREFVHPGPAVTREPLFYGIRFSFRPPVVCLYRPLSALDL